MKHRLLMAFFMSLFMAFIMSGVIILAQTGFNDSHFFNAWFNAFLLAWPVAFPTAFTISPLAHFLVSKLLRQP